MRALDVALEQRCWRTQLKRIGVREALKKMFCLVSRSRDQVFWNATERRRPFDPVELQHGGREAPNIDIDAVTALRITGEKTTATFIRYDGRVGSPTRVLIPATSQYS